MNVTFDKTGSNPVAELHDEGILFDDRAPSADGASADPQGGVDKNNENVTLSVPISDPDFGTPQGDSVDVTFYVDGSAIATKTISSNQTVSTTAANLADGSHSWHVEMSDSYGEKTTSSTWNFTVNHYAATTSDLSPDGKTFNDENVTVSGQVNDTDFAESSGDSVTVELFVDGSSTGKTKTITSNQTVSFEATELGDGSHSWHFETTDEYGLTSSSAKASIEVKHYAAVLGNKEASPQDGVKKDTREVTLSIPVNDTDFAETDGSSTTVVFYFNGNKSDSKTISSNQTVSTTVSVSTGGSNEWHVETSDEYSNTNQSDADLSTSSAEPFEFMAPSKLYVYNESAPQTKVQNVEVKIRFYGSESGYVVEKTTSDGSINMSGLPVDEPFVVIAQAGDYYNRRVYVPSLFDQQRIYLLNSSKKAMYNVFKLKDKSGNYGPSETRVVIQRALNASGNGLEWVTISGDYFGASNRHPTNLRYNKRYRIYVVNNDGDRRLIGAYMATDEQNPKYLVIREIVVSPPDGKSYYGTAWLEDANKSDDTEEIHFSYADPANKTDKIHVEVYEQGNTSNVIREVTVDDVGTTFTWSPKISGNKTKKTWVVNWTAERGSQTIGQKVPVGNGGAISLPISGAWLSRFMLVFIPILGALSSERLATFGALGTVAIVGIMMVAGWAKVEPVLWLAAFVVALGGHAFATATNRGALG